MDEETTDKPTRKRRLSRYVADTSAFPDFEPDERDLEIIELVFVHRFLDSAMLWQLLRHDPPETVERKVGKDGKARPVKKGFGIQALHRRLQRLHHTKTLKRERLLDVPVGRGYGSPREVYGIGPKGVAPLSRRIGVTPNKIRQSLDANRVGTRFLRHALEISRFRVMTELACRQTDGAVQLLFWEQGSHLRDAVTGKNEQNVDQRFAVCPDAFFGLQVKGKGRAHFFLEIDRGTEPIVSPADRPTILQKLLGYRAYRSSETFQTRYAYRTLPTGQVAGISRRAEDEATDGQIMITGFQVLFVVPGRIEDDGRIQGRVANILSAMPSFGKFFSKTSLFWFTTPDSYVLDNPLSLFDPIWLTVSPALPRQSLVL